jgi:hypothetical protein
LGPSIALRLRRGLRRDPLGALIAAAVILFSAWFILAPLFASKYPPMTDLPFHASESAIFSHYFDPSFHFKEQFELHPIGVPYLSMYVVAALLMRVTSAVVAIKLAAAVMLALLPIGLAVLFHGMKKTPLLGVLGLGLVWCTLTHWGFLNFVGAVGLFCMAVGLAMLVAERPTPGRRTALGLTMIALFFTHIFRFPFAVAGVMGAAVVLAPITRRRLVPVIVPLLPSLLLFAIWFVVRPKALEAGVGELSIHPERFGEVLHLLVGGFNDPAENIAFALLRRAFAGVALVSLVIAAATRFLRYSAREWERTARRMFVVTCCLVAFVGLFLVLPMQMGAWWYVYPREATSAAFVLLALFPNLPKHPLSRLPLLAALLFALASVEGVVEKNYASFESATVDFDAVAAAIPKAPKLLYLIFDHRGSTRQTTPFIHLPAYVQADKGGWLSFHFAVWGASPVAYRSAKARGAVVPPPVPNRWEWTPQAFDVQRNGAFFDWFLVRIDHAPDLIFKRDPSIVPVKHAGKFWLYRRVKSRGSTAPHEPSNVGGE